MKETIERLLGISLQVISIISFISYFYTRDEILLVLGFLLSIQGTLCRLEAER